MPWEGVISQDVGVVSWLHISDFHFKSGDRYDQDVVTFALLNSLPGLIARSGKPNFVVASGDVAFSGRPDQYAVATLFFDKLLEILGCVDKRDSQSRWFLIQDCFLGSSHGSRGFIGRRMGAGRAAVAV